MKKFPIGVLDSGVGGLSVLLQLQKIYPHEDFIYVADTVHFPYGEKSLEQIGEFVHSIASFLVKQHQAKFLVIACHTASGSLKKLKLSLSLPFIDTIGPTLNALLPSAQKGRIGLMGTEALLKSNVYQEAINAALPHSLVFPLLTPKLISNIQENRLESLETSALLEQMAVSIKSHALSTVVLASTHYAYLEKKISTALNQGLSIINPAESIALACKAFYPGRSSGLSECSFFVSGEVAPFEQFVRQHFPSFNLANCSFQKLL